MVLTSLIAMLACLITYFAATNHTLIIIVLLIMGTFIYAPATLVIGWLVQAYGWSAGNIIVYIFAGIAILASIYILVHQNRLYKKIDDAG